MQKKSQWHMRASEKDLQDIAKLAKLLKVKESEAVRTAVQTLLDAKKIEKAQA